MGNQSSSSCGQEPRRRRRQLLLLPSRTIWFRQRRNLLEEPSTVIATTATPFVVEWNATLKRKEMRPLTDASNNAEMDTVQGQVTVTVGDIQASSVQLCAMTIVELLPGIGTLRQCDELIICCNQLTRLPVDLGLLTQLKSLSLSYNHLRQLPDCIGSLQSLEVLKLDHNRLIALPDSLSQLKQLQSLHLQDNQIMELPSYIGSLESITELDISRNPIRILPAEIRNLRLLRRFYAVDCSFVTDARYPLQVHVPSLKELCARALWPGYTREHTEGLTSQLQQYMSMAKKCSYCDKHWFETHVVRPNVICRGGKEYPILYRLCSAHWFSEQERIRIMFEVPSSTRGPTDPQKQTHHRRHLRWKL